ncbi:unnamed protein product [Knipowitschia caucasica]|uniref:TNFAIP3-interacting protein 3-like n=1 Tax=Knipowitschia caucasica TaxID=637954 RepID=A0AAV2L4J1_KNICA
MQMEYSSTMKSETEAQMDRLYPSLPWTHRGSETETETSREAETSRGTETETSRGSVTKTSRRTETKRSRSSSQNQSSQNQSSQNQSSQNQSSQNQSLQSSLNHEDTVPHRPGSPPENTQNLEFAGKMKEQIRVLEMQKLELLSINERWAKEYRVMVHYYKEKLHTHKASLPKESNDRSEDLGHVCKLNLLMDNTTTGCSEELVKAQSDARALQEQNRTLARRGQHQRKEITRLNKALEDTFVTTSSSREMSHETLQDLWKYQADVYKEDFLTERKDREALQTKYLALEQKYKRVRNELYVARSQVPCAQCECTCTHPGTEDLKLQQRNT